MTVTPSSRLSITVENSVARLSATCSADRARSVAVRRCSTSIAMSEGRQDQGDEERLGDRGALERLPRPSANWPAPAQGRQHARRAQRQRDRPRHRSAAAGTRPTPRPGPALKAKGCDASENTTVVSQTPTATAGRPARPPTAPDGPPGRTSSRAESATPRPEVGQQQDARARSDPGCRCSCGSVSSTNVSKSDGGSRPIPHARSAAASRALTPRWRPGSPPRPTACGAGPACPRAGAEPGRDEHPRPRRHHGQHHRERRPAPT